MDHYNPSVRIIDPVSHTTYVVCVKFLYISSVTYSLKSTTNDTKPTQLLKNIWKHIHIFFIHTNWKHETNTTFKKIWKRCVSNFDMKIITNNHTLLYNRPTIQSIQRYNCLCELTKTVDGIQSYMHAYKCVYIHTYIHTWCWLKCKLPLKKFPKERYFIMVVTNEIILLVLVVT